MNGNRSKPNRMERINSEFRKDIYEIISRKIKNPSISAMFSILEVDTSKDLSHAKVYVSVYSADENKRKSTFDAIKSEAKQIRKELARSARIRTVPELTFIEDSSMQYGDKMDKLLLAVKKEDEKSSENSVAQDEENRGKND